MCLAVGTNILTATAAANLSAGAVIAIGRYSTIVFRVGVDAISLGHVAVLLWPEFSVSVVAFFQKGS
jgi:hypothetical protein